MQTAIQHSTFPDGGFVLHKVTFPMFAGRFSAWFDRSGKLLDAEAISDRNRCTQVKRDGVKWGYLSAVGKRYVPALSPL